MNIKIKYIMIGLGSGILFLIILVFVSLHGMEIEDHYGGLQEIYYKSKDNDILINEQKRTFGIVNKGWKNLSLSSIEDKDEDLFNFSYNTHFSSKLKLYRFKRHSNKVKQMNYEEIIAYIKREKPTLIYTYIYKQ